MKKWSWISFQGDIHQDKDISIGWSVKLVPGKIRAVKAISAIATIATYRLVIRSFPLSSREFIRSQQDHCGQLRTEALTSKNITCFLSTSDGRV
jgi:hypothetical protein